jgi:sialate O-acetylesterase
MACCHILFAQLRTANIFGDHMVLQREKPIPVWGTASPGEKVTVSLNGASGSTKASKTGEWRVLLPAMTKGGPHTMTVQGRERVVLEDILIGEVWLCSGQSNMEWPLNNTDSAKRDIAEAGNPMVRHIKVPRRTSLTPKSEIAPAQWEVCTPETAGGFTAVGYHFAKELHARLGVPVGLVNSSWGGTHVETWTSADAFFAEPAFAGLREKMPKDIPGAVADGKAKAGDTALGPNAYATLLYNAMIHPLVGMGLRGAIWYQGESNAVRAGQYNTSFPLMITDWRRRWKEDFPFYFVQLANYRTTQNGTSQNGGAPWAELREAQDRTQRLTNTGMAVILDIGNSADIHPRNKREVGRRLALQALNKTYGLNVRCESPSFESMRIDGHRAVLTFRNTFGGLTVKNRYGYVNGFELAGEDGVFRYAKAWLEDGRVVVSSEKVARPVSVRYAWADDPDDVNLFNSEGLPAAPFRTDDLPSRTKGVRFGQ